VIRLSGNNEREGMYYTISISQEHQALMKQYLPKKQYQYYIITMKRFHDGDNNLYRLKFRIWVDGIRPGRGFVDCIVQKWHEIYHKFETIDVKAQSYTPGRHSFQINDVRVNINYVFEGM